jgi:response regulator RpfG family c-di-GMP phosphodiesterase
MSEAMAATTPPTLLFVDDEPSILSALRRLFRPHGYQIFIAESGAAGLEVLAKEHIDLVISDMRMPEMDGAMFLKEVRARWPNVMRILLTGYADITSTVAAINQGEIYRYISKPWDDSEIVTIVAEAIEHQTLKQENQRLTTLTQAQNDQLKELNAGLEKKVAERTAEVRQALAFVEQSHSELKKSFLTSVQVFAGLIELRNGTAGSQIAGHGRRVAEQARSVGQRLGLPDTEVQNIMLAGLLHDIGKIGLPDDLLTKPFNTLTPEQRALVVKHPVIGQNVLMGIEKFKDAAIIVRHHHECFDGSGYPDRLAGSAIPQGGRILQVVNDYDSLLIGTLVQRPLKPQEAQKFIIENRGKRYDPAVVDAFIALLTDTGKPVITEVPYRPLLLKPGMVLSRDFLHRDGYLLLAKGAVLTAEVIAQLIKMEDAEQHKLMLHVRQEEK